MNDNLIKIEKIGGKTIYFDKQKLVFVVDKDKDLISPSYRELIEKLNEKSKTNFKKKLFYY